MMTQVEESYAAVLLEQGRTKEEIAEAEAVLRAYPPLPDVLSNPTIPEQQRFAVIERFGKCSISQGIRCNQHDALHDGCGAS